MSTSVPIKLLVTGSVLDHNVGKDLKESQKWMPIYLITAKPSSNVINAPTKIQILEICVPIKENTVTKSFFCKVCGQLFTWVEQCRHHLKNNKGPGPPT